MLVLALETSCDETAAAVVERLADGTGRILSDIVYSQFDDHAAFGGVVPEIAARAHAELIRPVIEKALAESGHALADMDAIAATSGPGLIGGLIVGVMAAKGMAAATGKPFLGVNHLEGHALTASLTDNVPFPYLLLLVSGGHTQIVLVKGVGDYQRFAFPRPLRGDKRLDFSFSGLKTAVRMASETIDMASETDVADICASFQQAVADTLEERVSLSLTHFKDAFPGIADPVLVVAGGVAANQRLRSVLTGLCESHGFRFIAPPARLCTDNAAMIAWAAACRLAKGESDPLDLVPRPRWPLDEESASFGSGRKGPKA